MSLILAGSFFLVVMATVLIAGQIYLRTSAHADGLAGHEAPPNPFGGFLARLGRLVHRPGAKSDDLRKQLFRAGYRAPSDLSAFHGVQLVVATALALLLVALSPGGMEDSLLLVVAGAGFGFLLPQRVLKHQVKSRTARIRAAVPAALDLLVLALEAGQTMDQALYDTAYALQRVYPDLSSELIFCNLEMRAGTSRTDSLRRLAERCGEEEVKKFAGVLIDGERFGTSLGPALRTHTRFLRTRTRQAAQASARKLSVKLVIPVFFLIFPSVMLVTLGPAYLQLQRFLGDFLGK